MGNDSLSKGMFKNISGLLKRESITATEIFCSISSELENKKNEYCNIKNRKIRHHLFYIILPAISVYQALLNCNLSSEKAAEIIKECSYSYYQKIANFYSVLGRLPRFYAFFKAVFKYAMCEYPEDGWDIEWLVNNRDEVSFNMHSCLYYDTFKKYGCPELTHIFCGVDNLCYDNMSNKVKFVRTKTIAGGHELCNFRFLKT